MNQQKLELIRLMRNDGIKTELISIGRQHRLVDRKIPKNLQTLLSLEDCISIGLTMAKDTEVDYATGSVYTRHGRSTLAFAGGYHRKSDGSLWSKYGGYTLYFDYKGWGCLGDGGNKEKLCMGLGVTMKMRSYPELRRASDKLDITYNLTPLLI